jgi:peroxin-11B
MMTVQLVLRLGKPIEHLQATLRASASNESPVEILLLIAKHVGYFAFLSYDAIAWVCHFICAWPESMVYTIFTGARN